MKICATADFHGSYPQIPDCDLLLIAGDVGLHATIASTRSLIQFNDWLESLPASEIVGIAGNHDFLAEKSREWMRELSWTYLQDESVYVDGLKIYGTPWAPTFLNWAFMKDDPDLRPYWQAIPDDTDILITHTPPREILDEAWGGRTVGSLTLRQELPRLKKLKLHVFGHIHEQAGKSQMLDGVLYANVGARAEPLIYEL